MLSIVTGNFKNRWHRRRLPPPPVPKDSYRTSSSSVYFSPSSFLTFSVCDCNRCGDRVQFELTEVSILCLPSTFFHWNDDQIRQAKRCDYGNINHFYHLLIWEMQIFHNTRRKLGLWSRPLVRVHWHDSVLLPRISSYGVPNVLKLPLFDGELYRSDSGGCVTLRRRPEAHIFIGINIKQF